MLRLPDRLARTASGTLNTFELIKAMIEAGAACVHLEYQLSSAKECSHLGGKVSMERKDFRLELIEAGWSKTLGQHPNVLKFCAHRIAIQGKPERFCLTHTRMIAGWPRRNIYGTTMTR